MRPTIYFIIYTINVRKASLERQFPCNDPGESPNFRALSGAFPRALGPALQGHTVDGTSWGVKPSTAHLNYDCQNNRTQLGKDWQEQAICDGNVITAQTHSLKPPLTMNDHHVRMAATRNNALRQQESTREVEESR